MLILEIVISKPGSLPAHCYMASALAGMDVEVSWNRVSQVLKMHDFCQKPITKLLYTCD